MLVFLLLDVTFQQRHNFSFSNECFLVSTASFGLSIFQCVDTISIDWLKQCSHGILGMNWDGDHIISSEKQQRLQEGITKIVARREDVGGDDSDTNAVEHSQASQGDIVLNQDIENLASRGG